MKIKEHLHFAFTNPVGNLLAVANLAMMALSHNLLQSVRGFGKLANDMSFPATLASYVLVGSSDSSLIIPPLVYLQWIFIGWLAHVIARQIHPMSD
ncbi:MAG: hypothetical protein WBD27_17750 [Pyrinomonadaceae bacterium]